MLQGAYQCKQCRESIQPDGRPASGLARRGLTTSSSTSSFYYCRSPTAGVPGGGGFPTLESYESLDAAEVGRRVGITHAASVESFVDVASTPTKLSRQPTNESPGRPQAPGLTSFANNPTYNAVLVARSLKQIREGGGDVQGAVCEGCHSLLVGELRRDLEEMVRDRAVVDRELAALERDVLAPEVSDEVLDELQLSKVSCQSHIANLDQELAALNAEADALAAELEAVEDESDLHTRLAAAASICKDFYAAEEAACHTSHMQYIAERQARCESMAGLAVFFHIDAKKFPASINGFRFGLPDSFEDIEYVQQPRVPWEELNTGLGYLAMLIDTLRRRSRNSKLPRINFVLQGSLSRVVVPHRESPTSHYELFCSPGNSTTSLDEGLGYLSKTLMKVAESEGVNLEYEVMSHRLCLVDGQNPSWAMHMQQLLQNADHLMRAMDRRR